ncbi:hypothetical protein [Pandoraea terrae]|nr:hypothetical protein [Pandoraea terrae]
MSRIFATLNELRVQTRRCSLEEVARTVAAFLESQQLRLFSEHWDSFASRDIITMESLRTSRTATDASGNRFTPPEVMEASFDGVRHILREAFDGGGFGEGGDGNVDLESAIGFTIRLGSLIETLRYQWHSVVWTGAYAQVHPMPPNDYLLDMRHAPLARLALVDIQRRNGLMARDVAECSKLLSVREVSARRVLKLERQQEGFALSVAEIRDLDDVVQKVAVELSAVYMGLIESHAVFFLDEPHPLVDGATFREVIDAWFLLALLCHQIELMYADGASRTEGLEPIRLSRAELVSRFVQVLNVDSSISEAIVSAFNYGGKHQTLWSRPLLSVGDELFLLRWPFQATHLMRLVSEWAKLDKRKAAVFSEKGHRYEEVVSTVLKSISLFPTQAIEFKPMKHRLQVEGKTDDGRDVGDVDCAFVVEDTLFILECRAVPHPAEPFEFWLVKKELEGKVEQVLRKKRFLESNPEVVQKWLSECGRMSSATISRVVALVVSNSYLLEGEQRCEPYFVHLDTVFNLLLTGGATFGVGVDEGGQEKSILVDRRMQFATVSDAIVASLKAPAKAEAFKMMVSNRQATVPKFDEADASGVILGPVLEVPEDPGQLYELMQKCSFAPHMESIAD